MEPESEGARLRELFRELRRQDREAAPPFATVWGAAGARFRSRRPRVSWRRAAAAVGLAVALAVAAALGWRTPRPAGSRPPETELPWRSVVLISEWSAPTDFLLEIGSAVGDGRSP